MVAARSFSAVLALWACLAAGCGGQPSGDRFLTPAPPERTAQQEEQVEGRVRLSGAGPLTKTVPLPGRGPLVVSARAAGSERFRVEISASWGVAELFDVRGPVSGEVALPAVGREPIRVAVRAGGRWSLELRQPAPAGNAKRLPASFSGRTSRVIPVRIADEVPRSVQVMHGGVGRLEVSLVPYEGFGGGVSLIELSGEGSRRATITEPLAGPYLLWVWSRGDARWKVTFER